MAIYSRLDVDVVNPKKLIDNGKTQKKIPLTDAVDFLDVKCAT